MCNVLIVETEPETIYKLNLLVKNHFANVILLPPTSNKQEISLLSVKHTIDIIILSIDSDLDCFELFQSLRNTNPNLKCILLSSTRNFSVAQKALRHGMIDYLVKPINNDFIFALDRAIQSINQVSLLNIGKSEVHNSSLQLQHKILRYIHENYNKELSLSTLADFLFLSKHHTSRLVKSILGMTFSNYLAIYRIEVAKKNLSTTDKSISEISLLVGYNDPNYFSKKFKVITSYLPKEYRKIYQGIATIVDIRA